MATTGRSVRAVATTAGLVASLTLGPAPASWASTAFGPTLRHVANKRGNKEAAKRSVERGTRYYEQARYAEALAAFEEAATAYPLPDFQYNIGLCHERLGDRQSAIEAFEAYLEAKPDAPDAASVQHRIAELQRDLDPPQLVATPLGEPTGQSAATESTGNDPSIPRTVEDDAIEPGRERDPGQRMVIAGGVLIGVGAAVAIAGGVGFGVTAERRADEVDQVLEQGNPDELTLEETNELADEGDLLRGLQIASLGVGVTAVVTGLALVAAGRRRGRRVALRPVIGPQQAGLSLGGRF